MSSRYTSVGCLLLVLLAAIHCEAQSGPNFFVAAPSVLQIDVKQTVVVSVYKVNAPVSVSLRVEDKWGSLLYEAPGQDVETGTAAEFEVEVPNDKVPAPEPLEHVRYVYIRALSDNAELSFSKVVRVVLAAKSLSVFVQTDKPVYRRNEDVHIRIVAVDSDLLPRTSQDVTVDIKNPQDIIIDRIQLKSSSNAAIKKHTLHLGPGPLEGNWTIIARYGYNAEAKSEYRFEVKDYVLPRFEVKIAPPKYVLVNALQPFINFGVTAKYTYGEGVVGELRLTFGVLTKSNNTVAVIKEVSFQLSSSDGGSKDITFPNSGYRAFPLGQQLYIAAEVIDSNSGARQKTFDASAQFTDNPIHLDCDLNAPYYRPNLPLQMKVRAKYTSGVVVSNVRIKATDVQDQNSFQTTDGNGIASFQLNVANQDGPIKIQFQVLNPVRQNLVAECGLVPFSSPSNGNIFVRFGGGNSAEIGSTSNFEIIKSNNDGRELLVTALIISRGVIQNAKSVRTSAGPVTTFQVNVVPELASRFCVLAYYVEDNNDVVADATCVETEKSFKNEIGLSVETGPTNRVEPGRSTRLTVKAAKKSEIALMAVDKGLYILNSENKLSRDDVFQDLLDYDRSCGYTSADSKGVFDAVGLTSISQTNLQATVRQSESCPERSRRNVEETDNENDFWCKLGKRVFNESGDNYAANCNREYESFVDGTSTLPYVGPVTESGARRFWACCNPDLPNRGRSAVPDDYSDILADEDLSLISSRSYFPHVWLWNKDVHMGDLTSLNIDIDIPHSITEWVIQAIGLSENDGFGVSPPISLISHKSVFIECHLPFAFTRLEQVSLTCTIYNYNTFDRKCCARIMRPPEELCTTGGGGIQTDPICLTVKGENTASVKFPMVPLKVGQSKLIVRLNTELGGEEVTYDINVKPEGALRELDYSTELDPQGSNVIGGHVFSTSTVSSTTGQCFQSVSRGGTCEEPLDGLYTLEECCIGQIRKYSLAWGPDCQLCPSRKDVYLRGVAGVLRGGVQETTFYTRLPENFVAGSATAWLTVSGRYLTGTVTTISNIADLLRQPGGCGEQSLITFAPNVEIYKFLRATDPTLTRAQHNTYKDLIQRGYQHILGFRKADSGGFAVWPEKDAATWLSAFALRTICSARDIIFVEEAVVKEVIGFLISQQAPNGAFLEHQYIYHRQILGGVQGGDASLTAYVVLSILQCCNESASDPVIQGALCKAKDFFVRHMRAGYVKRAYTRALVYNALIKLCSVCEVCVCDLTILSDSRRLLDEKATITADGAKYWKVTSQFGRAYWYHHRPAAISVETTAYALCAFVDYGHIAGARPIAKWLNQQRNSKGAFISTQDTVVALHCLAKFSEQIQLDRQISVEVSAVHDKDLSHTFTVTEANADVNQRIPIPLNDAVTLRTTGNGLGIAQLHVEYNTPATDKEQCAFEFSVVANPINDDESKIEIQTCARYLGDGCSSMANIEVELPSGYRACNGTETDPPGPLCLSEVLKRARALGVTRYEVSKKSVVFYLDKICLERQVCLSFSADREYLVIHSHPVAAKVYDYYEPDDQCTTFYRVGGGSSKLAVICSPGSPTASSPLCVCGAGRCPRLERIENRLCNACVHHHYVYKVKVLRIEDAEEWHKIKVQVEQVLKPGRAELVKGNTFKLWIPDICADSVLLEKDREYHLQGRDGIKFVLDHTSHIEKWPGSYDECKTRNIEKCARTECKGRKGKARNSCLARARKSKKCKNEAKAACKDKRDFETYLNKITNGADCERDDLCR